jgi:hypothetical protein
MAFLGAKRAILGSLYRELRAEGSRVGSRKHLASHIDYFVIHNGVIGTINTYSSKVNLSISN